MRYVLLLSVLAGPIFAVGSTATAQGRPKPDDKTPGELILDLRSPKVLVRRNAARRLGVLGAEAAVPHLIAALKDPDTYVQNNATTALGRIGRPAIGRLLIALGDEDYDATGRVRSALAYMGATAVPALIRTLGNPDPLVRGQAALALGRIGPKAMPAVRHLLRLLADQSSWVRGAAASALGGIQAPAQQALPALIAALRDPESFVRYMAAGGLAMLGAPGQPATSALIQASRDQDHDVSEAAVRALGSVGGPAARTALGPMVRSLIPKRCARAAAALQNAGGPNAIDSLLTLLGESSARRRTVGRKAIEELIGYRTHALSLLAREPRVPESIRRVMVAKATTRVVAGPSAEETRKRMRVVYQQFSFARTDLELVMTFLRETGRLGIYVDWRGLARVGITEKTQVTLSMRNATIAKALEVILNRLSVRHGRVESVIVDGVVVIATPSRLRRITGARVRELLQPGPATTADRRARGLLMRIQPMVEFRGTDLELVLTFFGDIGGVPVKVNFRELQRMGVPAGTEVNLHLPDQTLATALRFALLDAAGPGKLTYSIRAGRIIIHKTSTRTAAPGELSPKTKPARPKWRPG